MITVDMLEKEIISLIEAREEQEGLEFEATQERARKLFYYFNFMTQERIKTIESFEALDEMIAEEERKRREREAYLNSKEYKEKKAREEQERQEIMARKEREYQEKIDNLINSLPFDSIKDYVLKELEHQLLVDHKTEGNMTRIYFDIYESHSIEFCLELDLSTQEQGYIEATYYNNHGGFEMPYEFCYNIITFYQDRLVVREANTEEKRIKELINQLMLDKHTLELIENIKSNKDKLEMLEKLAKQSNI